MIKLTKAFGDKYNEWLERESVDLNRNEEYRKWLRYELNFCHNYGHGYLDVQSLGLFVSKLEAKGQRFSQIEEASRAVHLHYRMVGEADDILPPPAPDPETTSKPPSVAAQPEGASWREELA